MFTINVSEVRWRDMSGDLLMEFRIVGNLLKVF